MIVCLLESSKIIGKLSGVSTKSQRMHTKKVKYLTWTFESNKLVFCV